MRFRTRHAGCLLCLSLLAGSAPGLQGTTQAQRPPTGATVAAQVPALRAPALGTAEALDSLRLKLDSLQASVDTLDAALRQRYADQDRFLWAIGIGFSILSFFGYTFLRNWARAYAREKLTQITATAVSEQLPTILADTQRRAEGYLLRLAKLLALRASGAHDQALSEFGWDGKVASLRVETPLVRLAIIECLHSAKQNRLKAREAAWEAVNELARDDQSPETLRTYLRLSISLRKYADGVSFYERLKGAILTDKESASRAATLFRKIGRLHTALEIAKRYAGEADLATVVSIAVLQRDLGRFDEVHDNLMPHVQRLIADPAVELPDGWHRVVNTFIANCLDRERPGDAVEAASFVMRSAPGPVEAFTVGRLVRALPVAHPVRAGLEAGFREIISRLTPGEATTRCKVILALLDNDATRAIAILQESILAGESNARPGEPVSPDVYYQRCQLGEVFIELKRFSEAIDVLMPATAATYNGEAKFNLALAYGHLKEGRDAARWLRQAVDELPKWAEHARDNEVLKVMPEVIQELAKPLKP